MKACGFAGIATIGLWRVLVIRIGIGNILLPLHSIQGDFFCAKNQKGGDVIWHCHMMNRFKLK